MADQVTISTFLELRDNLSEGMKKAAAAIEAATGRVRKARSDEEKAAERSAARKLALEINSAKMASRQHAQSLAEQARYQKQLSSATFKEEERRLIQSEQAARQSAARKLALQINSAKLASRQHAQSLAEQARNEKRVAKEREQAAARLAREIIAAHRREARERERIETQVTTAMNRAAERRAAIAQREAATRKRLTDRAGLDSWLAQNQRAYGAADGKSDKKGGLFSTLISADLVASGIKRALSFGIDATTDFIKKAIAVNREYEASISAIASAMYTMDISPSMQVAEAYTAGVVDILRKQAAKLPGEAADYVEVFQRTIPAAMQSGMKDSKKYAEFVSKYTAVAIQRGVGAKVAASNLQIMLGGTARAGTKMAQVLSAYTDKTIADLNKMSRAARFDLYQQAVESAAAGMGASASKAEAIFGTLKTNIEDIYRIGGGPLFESAKEAAKGLNEWFEKNRTSVLNLANTIAGSLGNALQGAVSVAKSLAEMLFDKTPKATGVAARDARLKEFQMPYGTQPFSARNLRNYIPFYGLYKNLEESGELDSILAEIEKESAATKEFAAANKAYSTKQKTIGAAVIPGTISSMADQATALIKGGMFKGAKKPLKDAFSDYMLNVAGINEETTQAVYEALTSKGVIKTAKPPNAPRGAPSVTPQNNFDFRHSRFDIKQEFAEGFDPDRIAVAFANDLGRLGDMKLQASYGLAGGVR